MYLQYIQVEAAVSNLSRATADTEIQYQVERLRPGLASLCRAVASIPVSGPRQRLAQSEIAKKVSVCVWLSSLP